jgi:hypothetical protein
MVDVSHWQDDFINGYLLGFKVQGDTILFHGFCAQNEAILRPIILLIFDNVRLCKEPFAIRIFNEIQLNSSFTLTLERPI